MWDTIVINPIVNLLLMLYGWMGNNFMLAIAVFTVVFRLLMLPLTLRQQRSSMKAQEMQPKVQAIQKKHKDDPVKMQEEFRAIGYNPAEPLLGCLPMLLQFPIWIGLIRAIDYIVAASPQLLYELTQRAYDSVDLNALLPVSNKFLWMNLSEPDPFLVLPILVMATMFLQQRLFTPKVTTKPGEEENPMASATKSMQYTMPIMFGVFSLQFAAGLSVYFVISNIIGIFQGFIIRRERKQQEVEKEKNELLAKESGKKIKEPKAEKKSSNSSSVNGSKPTTRKKTGKKKKKGKR